MNTRDIVVVICGVLIMFLFVGFMYDYYIKSEQIEIVKKNMKLDSVIVKQQRDLSHKDSIIDKRSKKEDSKINYKLNLHDQEIKKLIKELEELK